MINRAGQVFGPRGKLTGLPINIWLCTESRYVPATRTLLGVTVHTIVSLDSGKPSFYSEIESEPMENWPEFFFF